MSSSTFGDIPLRNLSFEWLSSTDDDRLQYQETLLFNCNVLDFDDLASDDAEDALIYITGYVAHKLTSDIACQECRCLLQKEKNLQADVDPYLPWLKYTELLDRGGLKYPSYVLTEITLLGYAVIQKLLSPAFETQFIKCKNQKKEYVDIVTRNLQKAKCYLNLCACSCGTDGKNHILRAIPILANIFLNNYRKIKNDYETPTGRRKMAKFSVK
jgi:hypothetical protein